MYWAFIYVSVHQSLHRVQLCITPWTIALQIPLFLEFSRKEYQSGFPFPFPGDLPNSGIKPRSPELQTWNLQADSLPSEPPGKPKVCVSHFSPVSLFVTPWTIAVQAPLSMEQSRQEYGVGCHSLLQMIFLTQGLNLGLPYCRGSLYYLSYQGSPKCVFVMCDSF